MALILWEKVPSDGPVVPDGFVQCFFCIFGRMISEIVLKKDIQASLEELDADRDVFEKAEFNSAGIRKMFEKYGEQVPVSIFNFWYDKHKKLEQRVSSLENLGKAFLEFFTTYLKECVNASSEVAKQILEKSKIHPELRLNQIRAGIPFADPVVKVMLVYKRTSDEEVTEQDMKSFSALESEILEVEENFVHEYSFNFPEIGAVKNSVKVEFHWLLSDERLNATALQNDYPTLVRF